MAPSAKCADVYVGYPVPGSFSYRVPEGMEVVSGTRVKVNFGGRNITAFVHAVHDAPPPGVELKNVLSVVDDAPVFDDRLIDLTRYVADFYLSSVGEALATALPSGERSSSRFKNPFQREE
ncbi:MAG TPA: hypothetical protein ENN21_01930, partial [Spirochaetes bacterium]|nr:hypothetical protein [Spirochaetota bacterium]